MFGLTPLNVISSFSQTVSGDFQYSENLSHDVIQQEIDFQAEYLKSLLSPKVKSYLNEIPYEKIVPVAVSGNTWEITLSLPASSIYKAFVLQKNTLVCSQEDFDECYDCYSQYTSGVTLTSISSTVYRFDYVGFNPSYQDFCVKYYVDSENASITSLKKILRDMVCANLSSRIYSIQDGKIAPITQYYQKQCENAEKMLSGNWIPQEFSRIKLLFPKSSFTTYKINRS